MDSSAADVSKRAARAARRARGKSAWYCSLCGTSFTTKWACSGTDRHLDKCHYGRGQVVHEEHLDPEIRNLVEANREMNSRKKSPRDLIRKSVAGYSSMPQTRRENDLRMFNPEDFLAFVKNNINDRLKEETRIVLNRAFSNPTSRSGLYPSSPAMVSVSSPWDVFGYESFFCPDCQIWEPLEVYFTSDRFHEEQRGHSCPKKFALIGGYQGQGLSVFARHLGKSNPTKNELCSIAEEFLSGQGYGKDSTFLSIFAVDNIETLSDGRRRGFIRLPRPSKGSDQFIVLGMNFVPIRVPEDTFTWVHRLIKETSTQISSTEFKEFVTMTLGATYLFIKIEGQTESPLIKAGRRTRNKKNQYFFIVLHKGEWSILAQVYKERNGSVHRKSRYGVFPSLKSSEIGYQVERPKENKGDKGLNRSLMS